MTRGATLAWLAAALLACSASALGTEALFTDHHAQLRLLDQRQLLFHDLPQWTVVLNLVASLTLLALWRVRADIPHYLWLLGASLCGNGWFLPAFDVLPPSTLLPDVLITAWFYCLSRILHPSLPDRAQRVLSLVPLAALLGFGLAAMLALPVLHGAIAAACGLALWLASSRQLGEGLRRQSSAQTALTLGVWLMALSVLVDTVLVLADVHLARHPDNVLQTATVAQIAGVLLALYFLVASHGDNLQQLAALNTSLDQRVQEAEAEFADRYAMLTHDALDAAALRERKTIYQSIHEDLSDKLLQLIYSASNPASAGLAGARYPAALDADGASGICLAAHLARSPEQSSQARAGTTRERYGNGQHGRYRANAALRRGGRRPWHCPDPSPRPRSGEHAQPHAGAGRHCHHRAWRERRHSPAVHTAAASRRGAAAMSLLLRFVPLWRALPALLSTLVLGLLFLGAPQARADYDFITQAEVLVVQGATPPTTQEGWRPVHLPRSWSRDALHPQDTREAWYRVPLPADTLSRGWTRVLMMRHMMNLELWVDNVYVGSGGPVSQPVEARLQRNWNRPMLWTLPASALAEDGQHYLYARLISEPAFGVMSPVILGTAESLQPWYSLSYFVQITLVKISLMALLFIGSLSLFVWLRTRQSQWWLMGIMSVAWALPLLYIVVPVLPVGEFTALRFIHGGVVTGATSLLAFTAMFYLHSRDGKLRLLALIPLLHGALLAVVPDRLVVDIGNAGQLLCQMLFVVLGAMI